MPEPSRKQRDQRAEPDAATADANAAAHKWLIGGGEMGERTRVFDWSTTPLGAIYAWPQSLKTAVSIMLGCKYPLLIWWGPDLIHFYNDAYLPVLGKRHPSALGRSAPEVWSEAWPLVGPQADAVMREGKSHWNEELLIVMTRNGYPEEVYMTFSYGPILDDTGQVGGVFCACTEETPRVLSRRHANDLPFALLYLLATDGTTARLVGQSGRVARVAAPKSLEIDAIDAPWPFREVAATGKSSVARRLPERLGSLLGGPWPGPRSRQ